MALVTFTPNLQRHITCPPSEAAGRTVREVLDFVFSQNDALRGYILDDQCVLRRHMNIFVNGEPILDRTSLSDRVSDTDEVFVLQALSGG
ncbi:MAG: MoaD/ThiS family protein [Candidatus Hydrogenedentes bacterium]|nr:MoaD/ThiS family protein [Candidatus Hydrogenedentota bacterium]